MTKALSGMLTAVALFAVPNLGNAQLIGPGAANCAEFAEDLKENRLVVRGIFYFWTQGFVSGVMTQSAIAGERPLSDDDVKLLANDMDNQFTLLALYCDQHPAGVFADAVKAWIADHQKLGQ